MSRRRKYLICYDIADAKRLRQTAKICESFGTRIQFSVFESSLDGMMLAQLQSQLNDVIHHTEDQVLFVDLGADTEETPFSIVPMGLPYIRKTRLTII